MGLLTEKQIEELAMQIIARKIVQDAPVIRGVEIEKTIKEISERGNVEELQAAITLWIDLPQLLKKEYRTPCLTCMQTYCEEARGYCSGCGKDNVPVMSCNKLDLEEPHVGLHQLCSDCCVEQRLFRGGKRARKFRQDYCPDCHNFIGEAWNCKASFDEDIMDYVELEGESDVPCKDYGR